MTFLSTVDTVNPSYKAGIAAYYYHWTKPQSELGELSLTSDMTLIVKLKMKRTKPDLTRWLQARCKLIASSLQTYCKLINSACWNQLSFLENLISIAQKNLMQIFVQTKRPSWRLFKNAIVIMDISPMVSNWLIPSTETESGSWSNHPSGSWD